MTMILIKTSNQVGGLLGIIINNNDWPFLEIRDAGQSIQLCQRPVNMFSIRNPKNGIMALTYSVVYLHQRTHSLWHPCMCVCIVMIENISQLFSFALHSTYVHDSHSHSFEVGVVGIFFPLPPNMWSSACVPTT